jgi:hypothetical protein
MLRTRILFAQIFERYSFLSSPEHDQTEGTNEAPVLQLFSEINILNTTIPKKYCQIIIDIVPRIASSPWMLLSSPSQI